MSAREGTGVEGLIRAIDEAIDLDPVEQVRFRVVVSDPDRPLRPYRDTCIAFAAVGGLIAAFALPRVPRQSEEAVAEGADERRVEHAHTPIAEAA